MSGFLLGYCAGGLSLFLVWGAANAYRTSRDQAQRRPRSATNTADELALLRQGLVRQEESYRDCLALGLMLSANEAQRKAAEVRARIARLEQAAPG